MRCPRCHSRAYLDHDCYGDYLHCSTCGFAQDVVFTEGGRGNPVFRPLKELRFSDRIDQGELNVAGVRMGNVQTKNL